MTARHSARLSAAARAALAEQLHDLCDDQFSRRRLADATGLGIGTIRTLWKGESDPTLGTLLALVEGLGLRSVEELLGPLGTETMIGLQREEGRPAEST